MLSSNSPVVPSQNSFSVSGIDAATQIALNEHVITQQNILLHKLRILCTTFMHRKPMQVVWTKNMQLMWLTLNGLVNRDQGDRLPFEEVAADLWPNLPQQHSHTSVCYPPPVYFVACAQPAGQDRHNPTVRQQDAGKHPLVKH